MTAIELLAAISGTKSLAQLDGHCNGVWERWSRNELTDDQAQSLAESIEARRREVRGIDTLANRAPQVAAQAKGQGRPSHFPPKRKAPRSASRRASIERRRTLAASGPMPPQLACRFTCGELAALRIVADAVRDKGQCVMTLSEIAGRAGVCVTLARNALRLAAREGLVTIEERRRDRRPNLANVVRVISREWLVWIERGRRNSQKAAGAPKAAGAAKGGGSKKMGATDKGSYRTLFRDRVSRGQHPPLAPIPSKRTTG